MPFDPRKNAREEGEERKQAKLPEPWWKWHDSLTRFEGPIVSAIDHHFRDRWMLDGGDELAPDPMVPGTQPPRGLPIRDARVYCNEPSEEPNGVRELYLRLIRDARRSIFIENPYLYHPSISDALCAAKKATPDLEVVLVVPSGIHNDNAFGQDAQEHEYVRYLESGIEVLRVHESLQPPEDRGLRRAFLDPRLDEPQLPQPRGRQGLRAGRARRR